MNQFLNGFIPKAYRIRVNGNIDQKLYNCPHADLILSQEACKNLGHLGLPHCW